MSYLTALRALGSSPGQVSPATALRVRAAAERLDYRPNAAARALTRQTSPYIGLLYAIGPGCNHRIPAAEMMRAYADFHFELTAGLEARGYHILTGGAAPHVAEDNEHSDGVVPTLLQERHVGGMVIVGDIWPALHRELTRFHTPAVGIYCRPVPQVPIVDMDYRAAAYECTLHLLEQGHKRIAFIPGRWKTWKTEPMQLGYLAAMSAAGRAPVACWDDLRESSDVAVDLMTTKVPPTALVTYDDYEAARIIDRLDDVGIGVPTDVSIAAVQNMGPATFRRPTITGCPIPAVSMAQRAVQRLMSQFETPGQSIESETINASLAVAGSSAPPASKTKGS